MDERTNGWSLTISFSRSGSHLINRSINPPSGSLLVGRSVGRLVERSRVVCLLACSFVRLRRKQPQLDSELLPGSVRNQQWLPRRPTHSRSSTSTHTGKGRERARRCRQGPMELGDSLVPTRPPPPSLLLLLPPSLPLARQPDHGPSPPSPPP